MIDGSIMKGYRVTLFFWRIKGKFECGSAQPRLFYLYIALSLYSNIFQDLNSPKQLLNQLSWLHYFLNNFKVPLKQLQYILENNALTCERNLANNYIIELGLYKDKNLCQTHISCQELTKVHIVQLGPRSKS